MIIIRLLRPKSLIIWYLHPLGILKIGMVVLGRYSVLQYLGPLGFGSQVKSSDGGKASTSKASCSDSRLQTLRNGIR